MNDVVREIITTDSHWVISGLAGNGEPVESLALVADEAYVRSGIVSQPAL